jgi:hypothetical protein
MINLDVLIMASSRPQLIPYCLQSFERFVESQQTNIKFRYLLHEDFVFPKESEKVIQWAKKWGKFDVIIEGNPKKGPWYGYGSYV